MEIQRVDKLAVRKECWKAVRMVEMWAALLVVLLVVLIKPTGFQIATSNMVTNLFSTGGYGFLWWGIFGGVLVSVALPSIRKKADFADLLGVGLIAFFAVATTIHSMVFPGRLHPADSFNRVAFHILPIAIWYLCAVAGRSFSQLGMFSREKQQA